MSKFTVFQLPSFSDERGTLSVLDGILPFEMKRVYWISSADGQKRGGHRHQRTRQALIAVHGKVTMYMDDGLHSEELVLDSPHKCLLVEPKDWHTMTFHDHAVLLVVASQSFDRNDYLDEDKK